ncbi:ABC-2 type transport system ATP-binding protein [Clostridium punense]|uniref:ABC-2 type transport system ATP-binding protein n=1 Tax=Clostridium punense TaxID=1054297 RepID=A0ABS4K1U8_9CLOT|nr:MULTISPECIES: ATP-binding cassette domain-containing protein [Clostridium]EQB87602.1 ABC transporter ATP-binding protein [Clostridium sp. BL8]MBP2020674.1 ABC-2 type transport system ATP-binding protein [Clostridium punense]
MTLCVKNLTKKYGDKVVVDNLSFQIDKPGVYALLGTNGAGKTTTLRIILGMLAKNEGEVQWKGQPLDPLKTNVGYLAEERGLYPKYTLLDQLLYFAKLRNVPKKTALSRIEYWSERLSVSEYVFPPKVKGKKAPKPYRAEQLSKGNQQKIQLMSTLISDPELIILDEPLSGLDPVNTDLFKSIIREEISKNKYLIMSSHQMPTIEEFCSDITILNHGQAVLQGNLNEIKKGYGRVNLFVKSDVDISSYIAAFELDIVNKTPSEYHLRVQNEDHAMQFLTKLIEDKIPVIKFELREPSLHEIFIEKVGDTNEKE